MAENALPSTELAAASGRSHPVPLGDFSRVNVGGVLERLKSFLRQPAVAKSLPMVGLLGLLGAAVLVWAVLHTGPQRSLFAGLDDADKAAVAQSLDTAGIKYTLDDATGSLTVSDENYYRAKMLVAAQGLPKAAPDGDQMISNLPLGASRAVEGARLQQAQEMDLARTIEAIDAVQTAKVHVAAGSSSVFLRDDTKSQASVMLTLKQGRTLSDGQVQAIIHLVASSITGLSPDNVSVVDQAGHLLSRTGGGDDDATEKQVAMQTKVEDRYRQSLAALLTPILGEGNFTAEVHADLDFAQVASTTETFPKDGAVIRSEQGNWANDQLSDKPASGIPGALSNTAPGAAAPATTPNGQPQPAANGAVPPQTGPQAPGTQPGQPGAAVPQKYNETYNRNYELGHQISVTQNQVGQLRRLSVAVALRQGAKPLSAAQQQQIASLVKGAVGFDQSRGDVVAVTQQSFVEDAALTAKWYEASWLPAVGRNLTALAVAALLVFGIGRPLLKRRAARADAAPSARQKIGNKARERAEMGQEIADMLAQQEASGVPGEARAVTLDMIESAPGYAARAALIRSFVRQDPDRAALVVRDLIRADLPKVEAANG